MNIPDYLNNAEAANANAEATTVAEAGRANKILSVNYILDNNGFFPDLSLQGLADRYAIDASFSLPRQWHLLKSAMLQVNMDLERRYCHWIRQDYKNLAAVPQVEYGDEGELTAFYYQAVYAKTLQLLMERYRSTDTSRYGLKKAEAKDIDLTGQQYEDEYRLAIRNIVGQRGHSIFVDLI